MGTYSYTGDRLLADAVSLRWAAGQNSKGEAGAAMAGMNIVMRIR